MTGLITITKNEIPVLFMLQIFNPNNIVKRDPFENIFGTTVLKLLSNKRIAILIDLSFVLDFFYINFYMKKLN